MTDYSNFKAEDLLLDDSFIDYCRGLDRQAVTRWELILQDNEALGLEAAKAREIFYMASVTVSMEEKQEDLNRLRSSIGRSVSSIPAEPKIPRMAWTRWVAAAALVGVIAAASIWLINKPDKHDSNVANYQHTKFQDLVHEANDQRKKVELPDGSLVELNYNSRLKVAADFNVNERRVFLEGEAFFAVAKNASKPFTVITGQTATTALGTSFKVKDYPGQPNKSVMLATGKVRVESLKADDLNPIFLLPGEKTDWTNDAPAIKSTYDLSLIESWRNPVVILDQANLGEIIHTLGFYYGVQVDLQNRARGPIAFTGKFTEKPLEDVLEAIAFTNKFEYTRKGNAVSIKFQ